MGSTEGPDLYTATKAMLNFPIRPWQSTNAHSLHLGVSQLPIDLHTGLKRYTTRCEAGKRPGLHWWWIRAPWRYSSPGRAPDLKTARLCGGSPLRPDCWCPSAGGATRHRSPAPPRHGRELSLLLCATPSARSPHGATTTGRQAIRKKKQQEGDGPVFNKTGG